jgi:hypothetical protein
MNKRLFHWMLAAILTNTDGTTFQQVIDWERVDK